MSKGQTQDTAVAGLGNLAYSKLAGTARAMLLSGLVLLPGMLSADLLKPVQRQLPEFSLNSTDGDPWTTERLQGKAWVINFWATWCPPCIEEIPSMNRAWQKLEPAGVGMLAINAGEGLPAVKDFLERVTIDFPNLIGDAGTLANWSVRALPTTIVVNADGDIILEALGPREWDDDELLQAVLNQLEPQQAVRQ